MMSYLKKKRDIKILRGMPLKLQGKKFDRMLNTLVVEREKCDYLLSNGDNLPEVKVLLIADEPVPASCIRETLHYLEIQSCNYLSLDIIAPHAELEKIKSDIKETIVPINFYTSIIDASARLDDSQIVVFSMAGDLYHPSFASDLVLEKKTSENDVTTWNSLVFKKNALNKKIPCSEILRPGLQIFSQWQTNYSDLAFAAKGRHIKAFLKDYPDYCFDDGGHFFLTWVSVQKTLTWAHKPFTFLMRPEHLQRQLLGKYSMGFRDYQTLIQDAAANLNMAVLEAGHGHLPFKLTPNLSPRSISVIIPFRDKAKLTLKCVKNIEEQYFGIPTEVILVNNNSSDAELLLLKQETAKIDPKINIKYLDYIQPFNHSAQCNLGAEEASGEVLIFLNNDATISSGNGLETLSQWAMVIGVGTVGGRVNRSDGSLACAGICLTNFFDPKNDQPVCESKEEAFANVRHEIFGNTFACVAVKKSLFQEVGGLDEEEFPVGYNDVDFSAKSKRIEKQHMYLGDVNIQHNSATSRLHVNNDAVVVKLKRKYPEFFEWSLHQLIGKKI